MEGISILNKIQEVNYWKSLLFIETIEEDANAFENWNGDLEVNFKEYSDKNK